MGFELVRVATNANGMKIPNDAKCCVCGLLLDDGVNLSGCDHNACYECMKARTVSSPVCPVDSLPFNPKNYRYISAETQEWFRHVKLKCCYFDGDECTATSIAIRNIHRHQDLCANNPKNKNSTRIPAKSRRALSKQVNNWLRNSKFEVKSPPTAAREHLPKCDTTKVQEWIRGWTPMAEFVKEGGDKSSPANEKNELTIGDDENQCSDVNSIECQLSEANEKST